MSNKSTSFDRVTLMLTFDLDLAVNLNFL